MKINLISFIFLLSFAFHVYGQEEKKFYIGIEAGADFLTCQAPEKDYIRADLNTYSYGYVTNNIIALFYKYYTGLKIERKILKNRIGVLSGIRYSHTTGTIGKDTYWGSTSEYYFFRIQNSPTSTEYLRVKELKEDAVYLGFPLEIRIFPYKPRMFNIYYKIGFEFNFLMHSENDVLLYNSEINDRKSDIIPLLDQPGSYYSFFYLAVGARIRAGNIPVNIEGCVPSVNLFPETSGLVKPDYGAGFNLSVQFPL